MVPPGDAGVGQQLKPKAAPTLLLYVVDGN